MPTYLVTWEIDIDADSPEEAAEKALRIHRNPDSTATVFEVWDTSGTGEIWEIDLTFDSDDETTTARET